MRAAAEIMVRERRRTDERGGVIGKVERLVLEDPGLLTREIAQRLGETGLRVSGALNKLKLDGRIGQTWEGYLCRWTRPTPPALAPMSLEPLVPGETFRIQGAHVDAWCPCGMSILWGSLATAEERAEPRCANFPFAARGVA